MTKTAKSTLVLASSGMAILLVMLVFATPAQAISSSDRHDMLAGKIAEKQSVLEESLAVLESKPQDEWTPLEIQGYLFNAMWAVYYGTLQYTYDNERMPFSIESLANSEFIPTWPVNPFGDYAPMRVLDESEGFQPGELVLLTCPPEYYSRIKDPRPLSFEIGIYGPDEEFAEYGGASVMLGNDEWADMPEGVVYMAGLVTESGKHLKEKWEKQQREFDEQ